VRHDIALAASFAVGAQAVAKIEKNRSMGLPLSTCSK
jgi:hypothetical protein